MLSDVWCLLTPTDDDGKRWTGSKYLEYNPGSELNIFLLNKRTMNKSRTKNKWKSSNEQNKLTTTINNEQQYINNECDNWHKHNMHR